MEGHLEDIAVLDVVVDEVGCRVIYHQVQSHVSPIILVYADKRLMVLYFESRPDKDTACVLLQAGQETPRRAHLQEHLAHKKQRPPRTLQ